ncbi:MAG TPA: hypothetical protein VGV35_03205 [Bryobacteraceae bacterium]|nr:hypothetical protein [Bryobacteraceae bacterium]
MNRKLRLLDLGLLLLLALLGWQMRRQWVSAHAREQAFLRTRIEQKPSPPLPALSKVEPLSALSYAPMVQSNLFSKDRNPQVIFDPPAPVVEKRVPPFPVARGVMLWPGAPPTVVMSERFGGDQKGYHPGDVIGPWHIKSLDNKFIVLEWDGKEFKKRLDELMDRSNLVAEAPPPVAPSSNASQGTTDLGKSVTPGKASGPGIDVGGMKACIPGDTMPAGTVVDGWKKMVNQTPFGPGCRWEQAK